MQKKDKTVPIVLPRFLLPKTHVDFKKWAIIACDQFTSQPEYWDELKAFVSQAPSTYHMVLPEVFLEVMTPQMIDQINQTMCNYLEEALFDVLEPSMILVERFTHEKKMRLGLMLNIDLEAYSYDLDERPLIRTTEKTIVERIPPRLRIRKNAPIELTHVMCLIDDNRYHILESLYQKRSTYKKIYDFELNMNGGHIRGYQITSCDDIIQSFSQFIQNDDDILFVVGDGNHSLATAKAHWESIKKELSIEAQKTHPARFAMVEVVNLYDEGLHFEGIHRVLFNVEPDFLINLQQAITPDVKTNIYGFNQNVNTLEIPYNEPSAYEAIQTFIDLYLEQHKHASIDYIHGEKEVECICQKHPKSVGIIMPPIKKETLFPYIKSGHVLPRKSFSMGCATAKRYYLEGQKIK